MIVTKWGRDTLNLAKMPLDPLEHTVLMTAARHLQASAGVIRRRMAQRMSCEHLLNHLFAQAFKDHHLICVREAPYPDFGVGDPSTDRPQTLDLLVITPDKRREILIEAKQVHDGTGDAWRDRLAHGGSIAADITKLRDIPAAPGRTRLALCYFTTPNEGWEAAGWKRWLERSPSMQGLVWERLDGGAGPLFPLGNDGWMDILAHKLDE